MIITGLSKLRMSWKLPRDVEAAVEAMRRGSLGDELQRYLRQTAARIGAIAVDEAKSRIGGARLGNVAPMSAGLRENASRRSSWHHALFDTGAMMRGIYADLRGHDVVVSVRGPHAHLAAIHEYGAAFKVTRGTIAHFVSLGRKSAEAEMLSFGVAGWGDAKGEESAGFSREQHYRARKRMARRYQKDWMSGSPVLQAEAWARMRMNEIVTIPARPFLEPSIHDAMRRVAEDPKGILAQDLFNLWTNARATGGTRSESYRYNVREFTDRDPRFVTRTNTYTETRPEVGTSLNAGGGDGA